MNQLDDFLEADKPKADQLLTDFINLSEKADMYFDASNYSKAHELYDKATKKLGEVTKLKNAKLEHDRTRDISKIALYQQNPMQFYKEVERRLRA
ncbi:hypothetical protein Pryu01_03130 [Paraliobacillus ryukyuensis]|uniref:Uncharacterized protein n=1 Tax=Paraliobacillus ryukyuensis TaxID=200904 RepID=A0A366DME8_9BACI|nr:hypothetical protein [Paraliobacillus ryukyuensis]RBO91125.1 hypothetical protein DES48_1213 [Paraliobacillus ryukyuensis]